MVGTTSSITTNNSNSSTNKIKKTTMLEVISTMLHLIIMAVITNKRILPYPILINQP